MIASPADRRSQRQRVEVLLDAVDEADVVPGLVEGVRDPAVRAAPLLDDGVVVHLETEHGRLHLVGRSSGGRLGATQRCRNLFSFFF